MCHALSQMLGIWHRIRQTRVWLPRNLYSNGEKYISKQIKKYKVVVCAMKKLKQGSKSGWEDTFHLVVTGVSKEVLFKIKI